MCRISSKRLSFHRCLLLCQIGNTRPAWRMAWSPLQYAWNLGSRLFRSLVFWGAQSMKTFYDSCAFIISLSMLISYFFMIVPFVCPDVRLPVCLIISVLISPSARLSIPSCAFHSIMLPPACRSASARTSRRLTVLDTGSRLAGPTEFFLDFQ